jgi:hypothetical protein
MPKDRVTVGQVWGRIDEAASVTSPAFKYWDGVGKEYVVTRDQLEDYARRVFKVAVQLADKECADV